MDCPRCGAQNLEGAAYCASCGTALSGEPSQPAVDRPQEGPTQPSGVGPSPAPPAQQPGQTPAPTGTAPGEGAPPSGPWQDAHSLPPSAPYGPQGPTPVPPAGFGTTAPPPSGQEAGGGYGTGAYGAGGGYGQTPYGAPQQPYGQPFGGPPPGQQMYPGPRPSLPNYLVWSILTTLFCCLPAGVVSIVYAAQVNGKLDEGDYATAQRYSSNARTWAMVSAGLGLLGVIIYILFIMVFGVFSSTTSY